MFYAFFVVFRVAMVDIVNVILLLSGRIYFVFVSIGRFLGVLVFG